MNKRSVPMGYVNQAMKSVWLLNRVKHTVLTEVSMAFSF
jgi:hypothetical protein